MNLTPGRGQTTTQRQTPSKEAPDAPLQIKSRPGRQHRQLYLEKGSLQDAEDKSVTVKVHRVLQFHTRTDITAPWAFPSLRVGSEDRDVWQMGHCDYTQVRPPQALWNSSPRQSTPKLRTLLQGKSGDPCHLPLPPQDTPSTLHGLPSAPAPSHQLGPQPATHAHHHVPRAPQVPGTEEASSNTHSKAQRHMYQHDRLDHGSSECCVPRTCL